MSSAVIEKSRPLSIHENLRLNDKDQNNPLLWSSEMTAEEEDATDLILDHLIQSGARPHVNVTGGIVEIITAITNTLHQSIPSHLSSSLKIMADYIARWLCDYVEQTNASQLKIYFGFNAKISTEEKP